MQTNKHIKHIHRYLLVLILLSYSCKKKEREYTYDNIDFKQEMRNFVIHISQYAKNINPDFVIIPQNGVELITANGKTNGNIHHDYINAIDAQAQEGLFYGYENIDIATSPQTTTYLKSFLNKAKAENKAILVTDYCYSPGKIRKSRDSILHNAYTGFTATHRELDIIPPLPIPNENYDNITNIVDAENFLYLLNYQNFATKNELLQVLAQTNYDVLIIDMFFNGQAFTSQDISALKTKANGGIRKVIAYISIGEAENYRYYWNSHWVNDPPIWLDEENPDWQGNFKVRYWEPGWQKIIYGTQNSYIKKILDDGFDGAYLDIIDAFEFFENKIR